MSTTVTFSVSPDASLNIPAFTKSYTLNDPTDLLPLLAVYQAQFASKWQTTNPDGTVTSVTPTPAQVLAAVSDSILEGVMANVMSSVRAAKQAAAASVSFAGYTAA